MDNKDKIIKTLKDFGRLPFYRVHAIAGIRADVAAQLLIELVKEKKIIHLEVPSGNYYEVKK